MEGDLEYDDVKTEGEITVKLIECMPDSQDAIELMAELSDCLQGITGDSGANSFDPQDVIGERAVFLIAYGEQTGEALGCGAIRPMGGTVAELKRMYARRPGVGTAVLQELERRARAFGYAAIRLETRLVNERAVSFYEKKGYRRIPNYGKYEGHPEAVCFEKLLEQDVKPQY